MKRLLIAIIAIACLSGCCVQEWIRTDRQLWYTWTALKTADTIQTLHISKSKAYYEVNPILGEDPSQEAVIGYMVSTWLAATLLADKFPAMRRAILGIYIGSSATCVFHNMYVGINF